MITEEEIKKLVLSKVEQFKKAKYFVDGIPSEKDKELVPAEFNSCYKKCVKVFQDTRPHSQVGYFPEEIFRRKAPNQQEAEYVYSKEIFKITGTPTHSYWAKALSKINRIWNEKNYFIKYPVIEGVEYEDFQPKKYFEKDYPEYDSIEAYFREIVTAMKIEDPNAWAVLDVHVPMDGEMVDQSKPVEPYVCLIPCHHCIAYEEGEYLLSLSHDKSVIDYGGYPKMIGLVFEFRDRYGLYRIEQTGKQVDFTFSDPELIYAWELDYFPGQRLKGQPTYNEGHLYYKSYFSPAISSLNTALIDANTLQVSKINGAFPERWEYVDDCDAKDCNSGYIENWDSGELKVTRCGNCGGTGRKNISSKLSVIEVMVPKSSASLRPETDKMQPPFAGYVSKAEMTAMLQFLDQQVKDGCVEAFAFLNIDVSNSTVKGSETALGKQIDREELFSFLLQIANEEFGLLEFFIETIGRIRYGSAWIRAEIGYPQNFTIRSDADLTDELSKARIAGLPAIVQQSLINQYINQRFNSLADTERKFKLTVYADRLYSFTPMDIIQKLAVQIVAHWEAVLHDSIDQLIDASEQESPDFWDMEMKDQKVMLVEKAKVIASEIAPARLNVEDILI